VRSLRDEAFVDEISSMPVQLSRHPAVMLATNIRKKDLILLSVREGMLRARRRSYGLISAPPSSSTAMIVKEQQQKGCGYLEFKLDTILEVRDLLKYVVL
jgi:hypothetical protein